MRLHTDRTLAWGIGLGGNPFSGRPAIQGIRGARYGCRNLESATAVDGLVVTGFDKDFILKVEMVTRTRGMIWFGPLLTFEIRNVARWAIGIRLGT